jgi:DnaJ-class molecular chaperone
MVENFYEILEMPETANLDEIKKSYRRLSMMYHPDKNKNNPDTTAKFQKISEAYETLGDQERKNEYDMTRNNPFIKMMNSQGMNGRGMNSEGMNAVDEIFSSLFGMPFGQGSSTSWGQGPPFGQNIRVFHNGFQVNPPNFLQKPASIIKNIVVPINKILTGTIIPIDVERWLIHDGHKIFENETLYVTIPKGIDDGEIVILKEKGNISRDDCKGDIKIIIKIENNTEFKRSGLDLIYVKIITLKEALCGFTFELKYITDKVYTINNTSGNIISSGYNKIIPNMGFSRDQHIGNLIIMFDIKFPDKLLEEVIVQLKQIDF